MNTKVLPNHTPIMPGLEHPSLPGETIPAVLTGQPAQRDFCWRCQWLATMIRAGRDVEGYAWTAIRHVDAAHPGGAR